LSGYTVKAEYYSNYKLDSQGKMVLSHGMPIPEERDYHIPVAIEPKRSAFVIMDPWIDMPCDHLNAY